MKKLVVLTGSPRRKGNSNMMADAFIAKAKELGMEVVRFDAVDLKIRYCRACRHCYSKEGACIYPDDFNKIAKEVVSADGIVLVSPVYWYTFSAPLKLVIDKFYSFCVAKLDFSGKKSALVSCCGDPGLETFDGIRFAYQKTVDLLGIESVGEVLIDDVHGVGEIRETCGEALAAELAEKFL